MTADASLPPADERQPPLGEEELAEMEASCELLRPLQHLSDYERLYRTDVPRLSAALRASRAEVERLRAAIEPVRAAIQNAGPVPDWHRQVLRSHEQQWPTLWGALRRLLDAAR